MIIEKIYGPYFRKDKGRNIVIIQYWGGKRKYTSYARYLMEQNLKRNLNSKELVDHKDEVKTNDRIKNLQILTNKENIQKHHKHNPDKSLVIIKCSYCDLPFTRKRYNVYFPNAPMFCNKTCANYFRHRSCRN